MKKLFLTLTLVLFVIPFGISQDLPSYVPTDGLVAYYPFNGNANDESGNGNHGTVNGATLTVDYNGNKYSAYSFSSDTVDYISADASEFPSGNNPRTISVWYKAQEINSDGISTQLLGYGGGNAFPANCGESFIMNFENPDIPGGGIGLYEVQGHCQNFRRTSDIPTPLNNTWHHIAVTFDGDVLKFFNNGNLISTYSGVEMSTTVAGKLFCIGRETNETGDAAYTHQDYKGFTGSIDDVVIWNRALTDLEIANFYVSSTSDILLNGTVSAENHQIKNVADPTDAQDAVTKNYTYSKTEVDALIANLQQQINEMNQTITSSELEGNWNVKELYYLTPDTNEITSTFPTPECSKPYQYYEFLASQEIFWTGIGTNWVTQSCTSNEFGVKQDPYTITTENISGDDPITFINFPGGSGTRNWEVISRPSENTIIIRAWQNNEITLYNNEVYGLKLVKEARIE